MTDAPGPSASSAADTLAALEAAARILADARTVLVIDWPSRDVPGSLAFAGFTVFVKGGPGPADYNAWHIEGGEPVSRPLGHEPGRVDLVYCHRPLTELPGIIALAGRLGAGRSGGRPGWPATAPGTRRAAGHRRGSRARRAGSQPPRGWPTLTTSTSPTPSAPGARSPSRGLGSVYNPVDGL